MGWFMKEHDIHVENLLGELNIRFGPTPDKKSHFGGLGEMIQLQKEFKIFKKGRPFRASVAVLNVGAFNAEARNRMLDYFDILPRHDSSVKGENGDTAVTNAIIKNLSAKSPLPVYFTYHDIRAAAGNTRVLITSPSRPLPYFKTDYLTISFPTKALSTSGTGSKKNK